MASKPTVKASELNKDLDGVKSRLMLNKTQ